MNKGFYAGMAAGNIRKNARLYLPFLISSAMTAAMFYVVVAIATNKGISLMRGAAYLSEMLFLGFVIIAIFSLIFLLYTNSFIMKQRTRELGLYSILGMEKRHIVRIMLFESIYSLLISIAGGLLVGIVFDKLVSMLLCRIMKFDIALKFSISPKGVIYTAILFTVIFLICLAANTVRVGRANPIDLFNSSRTGEREPRTKWIMAILGLVFLLTGYAISVFVESPLSAILLFFVAVVCVIIGTYFLFIAGSIALLKLLRHNKSYYYKASHFNAVSGMLYRMKQNAAGLASICILSTMVLVMVSTTVSLYAGTENAISIRYPHDFAVTTYYTAENGEYTSELDALVENGLEEQNADVESISRYSFLTFAATIQNGTIDPNGGGLSGTSEIYSVTLMQCSDYNRLTGKNVLPAENAPLMYVKGKDPGDSIKMFGRQLDVSGRIDSFPDCACAAASYAGTNLYFVISDGTLDGYCTGLNAENNSRVNGTSNMQYIIGAELNDSDEKQIAVCTAIKENVKELSSKQAHTDGITYSECESRAYFSSEVYAMYGSFLFLGIVLGALFLMVTVMIIYYKQVSEGYDDRDRFRIMQQVGMSREEIRKTIKSQVLTVFFLPLVTAFIHLAFSFPIISKLLALLSLTNTSVFIAGLLVTSAIFTIIYTIVYLITARSYYRIVS